MNRFRLVRERGLFAPFDIVVYLLLAALIAALFFVFVVADTFGADDAEGVCVQVGGETVYAYTFGEGGERAQGWEERIAERTEEGVLYVRIRADAGWNELAIDDAQKTVVMHDADCSLRKDCTQMRAIGQGGSVITCIPHALKVVPLSGEDYSTPSVG